MYALPACKDAHTGTQHLYDHKNFQHRAHLASNAVSDIFDGLHLVAQAGMNFTLIVEAWT